MIPVIAVRYHFLYRWALGVTPAIWLLLMGSCLLKRSSGSVGFPILILCSSWISTQVYTGGTLPYLYYHMRFLVSEIIPLSVVVAAPILTTMWRSRSWQRYAAAIILVSVIICLLPFSIIQLKKVEGEDSGFFHTIDSDLADRDVFVGFESELDNRRTVPLRYYFGKQVFLIPRSANPKDTTAIVQYLVGNIGKKYGSVWLLSTRQPATLPMTLALDTTLQFSETLITNSEHARLGTIRSRQLGHWFLPYEWKSIIADYNLYHVNGVRELRVRLGCPIDFSAKGNSSAFTDKGWSDPEESSRWTDGPEATLLFHLSADDTSVRRLEIELNVLPFDGEQPMQVFVDGDFVSAINVHPGQRDYVLTTDVSNNDPKVSHELRFVLPRAHSPKSVGVSSDPRILGVSVSTITLVDAENRSEPRCN